MLIQQYNQIEPHQVNKYDMGLILLVHSSLFKNHTTLYKKKLYYFMQ
jgi:hypothetical protein